MEVCCCGCLRSTGAKKKGSIEGGKEAVLALFFFGKKYKMKFFGFVRYAIF